MSRSSKEQIHTSFIFLFYLSTERIRLGFSDSSVGKGSACNVEDQGSIPGWGRSPGEGNGNPLQYSCLGNPMDKGAWGSTVHEVTRIRHNLETKPPPPGLYYACSHS